MFLLDESELNIQNLFSEDDASNGGDDNNFQLSDDTAGDDAGGDTNTQQDDSQQQDDTNNENQDDNNQEEDNNEDDNQEEDFQLDDDGSGGENSNGGDDTGADTSSSDEQPQSDLSNDDELTKKYVLLTQYKDLHDTVTKLTNCMEKYFQATDVDDYDKSMYVFNQLKDLLSKITFTIVNKFENTDYQKLLTLFYYYQKGASDMTTQLEKVLDEEK